MFRLCQEELKADKYSPVRHSLYSYTTGKLNHRQFIALCEVRLGGLAGKSVIYNDVSG